MDYRSNILDYRSTGITPQLFQVVKSPGFRVEDVDDGIEIIHTYPFGMLKSLYMSRMKFNLRLQTPFYISGNTSDLGGRITFADDKKICWDIIQFPEI